MFRYYVWLAVRSLRRNPALTLLMVAAIGLGIGASTTMLTLFRAMSGDPIPQKSSQLFVPVIDNWGPDDRDNPGEPDQDQFSYTDAMALLRAHRATHQAAMYSVGFAVTPADAQQQPFQIFGRATSADFFEMFDAPFRYGSPWSTADDGARGEVVVIGKTLNDKLFGGANSVGKSVNLNNREYRVVGVLDRWSPVPRVYDVTSGSFQETEDAFIPFSLAIDRQMDSTGNNSCTGATAPGWDGHLNSECIWIQFWAELPGAAQQQDYRAFLDSYAADQQHNGRFHWAPLTRLYNSRQWMVKEKVVPDESRILMVVSFGFLLVCLVNAVGLMLAKFLGRAAETGVRRALGANRGAVFLQCVVESGVIGLAGGLLGLGLTALGLLGVRGLLSQDLSRMAHLDPGNMAIAVALAVVSALLAGLYPTWRAVQVQPAWQLKAN
jgi:putative ABC transport system permease protein